MQASEEDCSVHRNAVDSQFRSSLSKSRLLPFLSSAEFHSADLHRAQILSSPAQTSGLSFNHREASSVERSSARYRPDSATGSSNVEPPRAQHAAVPGQDADLMTQPRAANLKLSEGGEHLKEASADRVQSGDDAAQPTQRLEVQEQQVSAVLITAAPRHREHAVQTTDITAMSAAAADLNEDDRDGLPSSSQTASSGNPSQAASSAKDSDQNRGMSDPQHSVSGLKQLGKDGLGPETEQVDSFLAEPRRGLHQDSSYEGFKSQAVMDLAKQLKKSSLEQSKSSFDLILAHRQAQQAPAVDQEHSIGQCTGGEASASKRTDIESQDQPACANPRSPTASHGAISPVGSHGDGHHSPERTPGSSSKCGDSSSDQSRARRESTSSLSIDHTPIAAQPPASDLHSACMSSYRNPVFAHSRSRSPCSTLPSPAGDAATSLDSPRPSYQTDRNGSIAYRSPVFQRALSQAKATRRASKHSPQRDRILEPSSKRPTPKEEEPSGERPQRVSFDRTVSASQSASEVSSYRSATHLEERETASNGCRDAEASSECSWPSTLDFSVCSSPDILEVSDSVTHLALFISTSFAYLLLLVKAELDKRSPYIYMMSGLLHERIL